MVFCKECQQKVEDCPHFVAPIVAERIDVFDARVKSLAYDAKQRTLEIAFKSGQVWQLFGVPNSIFQELRDSTISSATRKYPPGRITENMRSYSWGTCRLWRTRKSQLEENTASRLRPFIGVIQRIGRLFPTYRELRPPRAMNSQSRTLFCFRACLPFLPDAFTDRRKRSSCFAIHLDNLDEVTNPTHLDCLDWRDP